MIPSKLLLDPLDISEHRTQELGATGSSFERPAFLRGAVGRYEELMARWRAEPAAFLVPSYDVDLIWHAHMGDSTHIPLAKLIAHHQFRAPSAKVEACGLGTSIRKIDSLLAVNACVGAYIISLGPGRQPNGLRRRLPPPHGAVHQPQRRVATRCHS